DYGYDAITGKRLTHLETVKGSKADAVNLLSKRLAERGEGNLVRSNTDTVAGYAHHWLTNIAPAITSPKTRERYAEHIKTHITPKLGRVPLQKLGATEIDAFYT